MPKLWPLKPRHDLSSAHYAPSWPLDATTVCVCVWSAHASHAVLKFHCTTTFKEAKQSCCTWDTGCWNKRLTNQGQWSWQAAIPLPSTSHWVQPIGSWAASMWSTPKSLGLARTILYSGNSWDSSEMFRVTFCSGTILRRTSLPTASWCRGHPLVGDQYERSIMQDFWRRTRSCSVWIQLSQLLDNSQGGVSSRLLSAMCFLYIVHRSSIANSYHDYPTSKLIKSG